MPANFGKIVFSRLRFSVYSHIFIQHPTQFLDVLLTVHLSIFILVINRIDAQHVCFTISLFHASTCFEHHVFLIRRSELYYTASGIITPIGGRPVHRLREESPLSACAPDGHLKVWWYQRPYNTILTSWWWAQQFSKHVQAWNKLIIKQKFCASSWLITKINPAQCSYRSSFGIVTVEFFFTGKRYMWRLSNYNV